MNYSEYTIDDFNKLTETEIQNLDKKAYFYYQIRNTEIGNIFLINGEYEISDQKFRYNGKCIASLYKKVDGTWGIGEWACGPGFTINPLAVNERTFRNHIKEIGVDEETVEKLVQYEINW